MCDIWAMFQWAKIGTGKCASHAGNSPFLITYHLIKIQLSRNLVLVPLKLCPNDHNIAPHLVSCHISDAIPYLDSSQEPEENRKYLSTQNAATKSRPKSSYTLLWGEAHSFHSGMTGSHFPYNPSRLDGSTGRKTSQTDLALYLCYIIYRLFNLSEPWVLVCKMQAGIPAHRVTGTHTHRHKCLSPNRDLVCARPHERHSLLDTRGWQEKEIIIDRDKKTTTANRPWWFGMRATGSEHLWGPKSIS